jgi:hypothetical protein
VGKPVDNVENVYRTPGDIDWEQDSLRFHKAESVHARFRM